MKETKAAALGLLMLTLGWMSAPSAAEAFDWKGKFYDVPLEDANFSVAWWRQASLNERVGFEFGTEQCLSHHLHKGIKRLNFSDVSSGLDKLAKGVPEGASVGTLLDQVLNGKQKSLQIMDYETAWGPPDHKMHKGIVEGYITCSERHSDQLWYNPVEYYVAVLNLMYDRNLAYGSEQWGGLVSDVLDNFGHKPPGPFWGDNSRKFKPIPEIDFDDDRPMQEPR